MAIRVEIDVALPIGPGPDGHVELKITIPDLDALQPPRDRYLLTLIEKTGDLAAPGATKPVVRDLRQAAAGEPVIREYGRRA